MTDKEELIQEIQDMSAPMIKQVKAFVEHLKQHKPSVSSSEESTDKKSSLDPWTGFVLTSGSFDFWNEPDEVEYTPDDITEK